MLNSLRNFTRPARRRIAKRIFNFPENWDHTAAQRYEIAAARQTIIDAFARNYSLWERHPDDWLYFEAFDQWFCGNEALFAEFRRHIIDKRCLEIGSGPFGHLGQSKALRHRAIIDPLIDAYRAIELGEFGKTFFTPDISTYALPAETRIEELIGTIDGLIVSRNCLDHCDDPLTVLRNIGDYAAPGCWLFIWTDIWHLNPLDEGHRNITRSPEIMRHLLSALGFDIIQTGRRIGVATECIEYGCIARRHPS